MKNLLIVFLFLLTSIDSFACNCFGPQTIEEDFEKSEYVFEGTIVFMAWVMVKDTMYPIYVEKGLLKAGQNWHDSIHIIRYTIEIQKSYKRKIKSKTIYIYSGDPSLQCGYYFGVGNKYIVFASQSSYFEWDEPKEVESRLKVITSECRFNTLDDKDTSKILKKLKRSIKNDSR